MKKTEKKFNLTKDELNELKFAGREISEYQFLEDIYNRRFNAVVETALKRVGIDPEALLKEGKKINPNLVDGILEIYSAEPVKKPEEAAH